MITLERLAEIEERAKSLMVNGLAVTSSEGGQRYIIGIGPLSRPPHAVFDGDTAHDDAWFYYWLLVQVPDLVAEVRRLRGMLDQHAEQHRQSKQFLDNLYSPEEQARMMKRTPPAGGARGAGGREGGE
jgi:hypothetical protein